MTRPSVSRWGGAVGLSIGLLVALAGNLTFSWPHGSVMIGAGIICPVILPLTLWIRSTFTVTFWLDKLIRDASVVAVAGPAAALSYQHTYMLMSEQGVPHWLAALLPLSADGIAALSTLALHRSRPVIEDVEVDLAEMGTLVEPEPKPRRAPESRSRPAPPSEMESARGQRQVIVEWVSTQQPLPTPKVIQTKWKVSRSTATRVLADVRSA